MNIPINFSKIGYINYFWLIPFVKIILFHHVHAINIALHFKMIPLNINVLELSYHVIAGAEDWSGLA